jgi:transcriptional regulator with GAF, ATPase, and Fis domain
MKPRLVALSGPYKGQEFPITDVKLAIGRAADNLIRLDDPLVSQHHCALWLQDGRTYLRDGDTRNGTWVNGTAVMERFMEQSDRIACGSTTFLYLEFDLPAGALPTIMKDEDERRYELETLRADYSIQEPAAIHYKALLTGFVHMLEALNTIPDLPSLQAQLLDFAFEVVPALRGAIMLNGRHVGYDAADFTSRTFRQRGYEGNDAEFWLSSQVLKEVYSERRPVLSNNIKPTLCAPLIFDGSIRGVLYLEGASTRNGFDREHLSHVEGIANMLILAVRLLGKVESIRDQRDLLQEKVQEVQQERSDIVGKSKAIKVLNEKITRAAAFQDATILILGETGTGKEMVARLIHEASARREGPFVTINCAAIPEPLLESELFGHVKGAFTGATTERKGKFQMADDGTIFLDEIGEMSLEAQKRLLRVLQEQKFSPVGSEKTVEVDVRVIAATNVKLEKTVRQGRFREDVFYRLRVFVIDVPPLRDRLEDIPILTEHFLQKYRSWSELATISPEAMEVLMAHEWRGNVRELEHVIQAAIMNANEEIIRLQDLPEWIGYVIEAQPDKTKRQDRPMGKSVRRTDVQARVEINGGDVDEAARYFGISRSWAYKLLAQDK